MRCSLENKSLTKHEKRGRVLIHIPGAWSYPSRKQVTPTHSVNVCMFYLDSFCDQALECSVNSKRYYLPTKIIPPPCAQGTAGAGVATA